MPWYGTQLMLIIGSLAALGWGFLDAVLCHINPGGNKFLMIMQVVVTVGFGVGMGCTVNGIGHLTKVRNQFFSIWITLLIGVMGLYFSWVWYIYIRAGWDWNQWSLDPVKTWTAFIGLANAGPRGDLSRYLEWSAEAITVMFGCYASTLMLGTPFCEECDSWTVRGESLRLATGESSNLTQKIEDEQYGCLIELVDIPVDETNHLSVVYYMCPKCEASDYLTISHVKTKPQSESKTIVELISIPRYLAEALQTLAKRRAELAATEGEIPTNL